MTRGWCAGQGLGSRQQTRPSPSVALQGYHGTVWAPVSLYSALQSRELLLLLLLLEGGDIPSALAPVRKWRRAVMAAVVVFLVVSGARRLRFGGGGAGDGDGDRDVGFVMCIGLLEVEFEGPRLRLSFVGD